MSDLGLTKQFLTVLNSFIGREVFYVYCGPSTGAVLDIHFTPVKPRIKPLKNRALSELHSTFMGDVSLFINCSWRLQRENKIISGSGDCIKNAEEVHESVRSLGGLSVINVFVPPMNGILDLILGLQDGSELRLFCDSGVSPHGDYDLFYGDNILSVSLGSQIQKEEG